MPFNGSGVFSRLYSWVNDAAANIKIRADRMDNEMDGFATGLSTCITKDGQTTITANLPMAGFRHTGVGNAAARNDYASFAQVQDGKSAWVDGGGTADAITATYSIPITSLVDGQLCFVRATAANATTTPTFSPNSLTPRTIVKQGGAALAAGEIAGDGHELILRYDLTNTRWELLNPVYRTATTQSAGNNSTSLATTAYVDRASGNAGVVETATDVDNYAVGVYLTPASGVSNLPPGWAQGRHMVFTYAVSTYKAQVIYGESVMIGRTAVRTYNGSSWTAWTETTNNIWRNSAQFDVSASTTLADVTGLSASVQAGGIYAFEAVLYTTSNVAGGVKAAIAGTATATAIVYESLVMQAGTTVATGASRSTALAGTVANVTAVTAATIVIKGTITVNAAGTLTVQFSRNAANGTSSVLVGSTFEVKRIGGQS